MGVRRLRIYAIMLPSRDFSVAYSEKHSPYRLFTIKIIYTTHSELSKDKTFGKKIKINKTKRICKYKQ